jgi:tetratricopeptide (TPR) repeat protein
MLEFRPHHFLCTLGFEGKGYSEEFVEGYRVIADQLRESGASGEATPIRVTSATDSICAPCPNRQGARCATEAKIQSLDNGHAAVLNLVPGQILSWAEAKSRIAARMSDADFDRVCAPCSWKPMGVCKKALHKVRAEHADKKNPSRTASSLPGALLFVTAAAMLMSFAAQPARAAFVREDDDSANRQRPLDIVRTELPKKHKSKPARALKKAWEALQAKKHAEAVRLASPLAGDPLFGDYGNWITASAQYGVATRAFDGKRYGEAIRAAEASVAASFRIETKSPYSPMLKNLDRDVGLSEVMLGDAQAAQKRWKPAAKAFEQGFQRLALGNGLGLLRPDSLQRYAKVCAAVKTEMCDAWIQRFAFFYPKNSEEMRAITQVLPGAADRPRPAFSGKYTQSYKAPDLDQTAFEQNMALYLDGKFGTAIRGFQQFIDEFPKSPYRFRVRYWLAQAQSHEQQHEKAQAAYESIQHDSPLTYYGLLSAFAAGHNMDAPIDSAVPMVSTRDPLLRPSELQRIRRAEHFITEGASDLALMELKEFRSRDALSSPFLMYLAALATEVHAHNAAFGILSDLIARNYGGATSAQCLSMIFPVEQMDEIKKQTEALDVDPILVLSLIKQESAFDKSAVSSSGALGLMQLMPATASDTDPTVARADLVEAPANVRVGTKYLKKLLTRFNGNIVLSLAGYNAGPNAADRWFKEQGGKRGMVDFIETIPYRETREYVAAIIRNYYWYSRKLTPSEPAKPLNFFWAAYKTPAQGPPVPDEAPAPTPAAPAFEPFPAASLLPVED